MKKNRVMYVKSELAKTQYDVPTTGLDKILEIPIENRERVIKVLYNLFDVNKSDYILLDEASRVLRMNYKDVIRSILPEDNLPYLFDVVERDGEIYIKKLNNFEEVEEGLELILRSFYPEDDLTFLDILFEKIYFEKNSLIWQTIKNNVLQLRGINKKERVKYLQNSLLDLLEEKLNGAVDKSDEVVNNINESKRENIDPLTLLCEYVYPLIGLKIVREDGVTSYVKSC